ncbi:MAG: recombinase family protein [Candidatus Ornithospirochaeta sp.]
MDSSELTIIPAKPPKSISDGSKRRVAVYIRVSTDNDEQTSSFKLQKNSYPDYVKAQLGWELVDIYADEGISGTQIKHRVGLQRLLDDCDAGKVDYIITKSISRFTRNSVDCLNRVEHLSNLNPPVGIIFEAAPIDTLRSENALLLTILASLAEAESRTKSDIMEWSVENRFLKGIFLLPELIGLDKYEDENLVINDEADTVRICFYLFLSGYSIFKIAESLTAMGRKTGYNKLHNKKSGVTPMLLT